MKHPYEKFILIELITLACAAVIGLIALIKGYLFLILFCLFLISISLVCDGMMEWNLYKSIQALKQVARAVLIVLFSIYFLFQL